MKVKVYVTLKRGTLDPQGSALEKALHRLHFQSTSNVRVGKLIEFDLNVKSEQEAKAQVIQMCEKLLSNPVIEDTHYEFVK